MAHVNSISFTQENQSINSIFEDIGRIIDELKKELKIDLIENVKGAKHVFSKTNKVFFLEKTANFVRLGVYNGRRLANTTVLGKSFW